MDFKSLTSFPPYHTVQLLSYISLTRPPNAVKVAGGNVTQTVLSIAMTARIARSLLGNNLPERPLPDALTCTPLRQLPLDESKFTSQKNQSHHSKIIPNPFIPIHKQPLSPPPGKPEN